MKTYKNVAILAALCVTVVVSLSIEAKVGDKDTKLLDQIITHEIDSRHQSIKHWTQMLTVMDMALDGEARVHTFMELLKREIAYLGELKAHGVVRMKKAYCTMVLQQRISVMSYEVKFKKQFGNESEALPRVQTQRLSDKEVEAIRKQLKEAVGLKKKIESITTN